MKTMHLIGNAHIDPVWLWRWPEGFQEVRATFQSALDRLDETEDFVFTSSSAQYYEWVEENSPALFERIRARVAQGRWLLCGGWWVQPDCNIPCGESLARQSLYGQRYFLRKFGVAARIGYNVDSFGHCGSLPQILRKSGMDFYVFMRPMPREKALPAETFVWESPDGSQVLAYRIPFAYCTFRDLEEHIARCAQLGGPGGEWMCFYGVGDHGGGPTIENLKTIRRLRGAYAARGVDLRLSDPQTFFDKAALHREELPVVRDDLQYHSVGCYSAVSEIKRLNRQAENALLSAEKFSSLARMLGRGVEDAGLARAWKNVLFNQFHDILAGSAIREAYFDARNEFGEALAAAGRCRNGALQAVSQAIAIPPEAEDTVPLVVFNPHAWPVTAPVRFDSSFRPLGEDFAAPAVTDAAGRSVPAQFAAPGAKVEGFRRVVFEAQVPPLGYALYRVRRGRPAGPADAPSDAAEPALENGALRLAFGRCGGLAGVFDKRAGAEAFAGEAAVPVVIDDPSDTWSHDVRGYGPECGRFETVSVRRAEAGPVRGAVEVVSRYGRSTVSQTFTLGSGAEIVVDIAVDWHERCRCLKLEFPVAAESPAAHYQTPFGQIARAADGREYPLLGYADLSAEEGGVAVLNDGKYGADAVGNRLRLTVLRSPLYAWHLPYRPEGEPEDRDFVDQGFQSFRYVILPHRGRADPALLARRALELNQPLTVLPETFHPGPLPASAGFLSLDAPNILVSAFKRAEEGEDYILRACEAGGRAARARFALPALGRGVDASFGPWEIKTFRIPADRAQPVRETDLLER